MDDIDGRNGKSRTYITRLSVVCTNRCATLLGLCASRKVFFSVKFIFIMPQTIILLLMWTAIPSHNFTLKYGYIFFCNALSYFYPKTWAFKYEYFLIHISKTWWRIWDLNPSAFLRARQVNTPSIPIPQDWWFRLELNQYCRGLRPRALPDWATKPWNKWTLEDLNLRPGGIKPSSLPTELNVHMVTRAGFEPTILPWKGSDLTTCRTGRGGPCRVRTCGLMINSHPLYLLS